MTFNGSKEIGAISVALYLTLPTLSLNPYITLLGEAIIGSISQMVKLRLTDTQSHTVNQWQNWGPTHPSLTSSFYVSLPATNNKHAVLKGSGRGYLLSPWWECLQPPGVTWSCSGTGSLVSSWYCPVAGCQLSRAPCFLLPHLEPAG